MTDSKKLTLDDKILLLEDMAKEDLGLDFFPINYEIVPQDVMLEVISYGLPTRARHWSYGRTYEYQKISGKMGSSKVYELVLNNDPSYAFLLATNSEIANVMVSAHVIGHVHFFKNNYLFKETDRKMIYQAAARASRIEGYIEKYGLERVERIMDIGFALDKHIDWHKGVHRDRYPGKKKIWKKKKVSGEFDDMLQKNKPNIEEVVVNDRFPPHRERDILWFLINYAQLEPWQKDILEIIREESYYFYPQYYTKIMNEGFASYVHAELMCMFDKVSPAEHLEFCKIHEKVVQPGSNKLNINPYFLGFTILNDIKDRWDKKFESGESEINGWQKILEVVEEEDDISFINGYLTQEIVDRLKMFTYISRYDQSQDLVIRIESTKAEDVAESVVSKLYNYRAPLIMVDRASSAGLELIHESPNNETLDENHMKNVMQYIHEIWGGIINMESKDESGEAVHYTYDDAGFSHDDDSDDNKGFSFHI